MGHSSRSFGANLMRSELAQMTKNVFSHWRKRKWIKMWKNVAAKRPDKIKTRYWKTKCSAIICPTDIFRKKNWPKCREWEFSKKIVIWKKIVKINFNQASDSHDTGKLFSIFGQFFFCCCCWWRLNVWLKYLFRFQGIRGKSPGIKKTSWKCLLRNIQRLIGIEE